MDRKSDDELTPIQLADRVAEILSNIGKNGGKVTVTTKGGNVQVTATAKPKSKRGK